MGGPFRHMGQLRIKFVAVTERRPDHGDDARGDLEVVRSTANRRDGFSYVLPELQAHGELRSIGEARPSEVSIHILLPDNEFPREGRVKRQSATRLDKPAVDRPISGRHGKRIGDDFSSGIAVFAQLHIEAIPVWESVAPMRLQAAFGAGAFGRRARPWPAHAGGGHAGGGDEGGDHRTAFGRGTHGFFRRERRGGDGRGGG